MKLKTAFAVMVLLFAPAAASSTSKAALIGGSALSMKAATVDIGAVSKVYNRRHYRQRHYRRRYTSRRVWRPRYWTYQPHYSPPLLYDSPYYYYSTSPYGYPFYGRFGSPYSRWYRGGPYLGYGW
jgi:hypothetical protein